MSDKKEQPIDPAGSTVMFRKFVSENDEPETKPRRPVVPYLITAVVAVVAIGIIVTVVMTWS